MKKNLILTTTVLCILGIPLVGSEGVKILNKLSQDIELQTANTTKHLEQRKICFLPITHISNSIKYRFIGQENWEDLPIDNNYYALAQPQCYAENDIRCTTFILQEAGNSVEALSKEFFILCNTTSNDLWCAWYGAAQNDPTKIQLCTTPRKFHQKKFKELLCPHRIPVLGLAIIKRQVDTLQEIAENDVDLFCLEIKDIIKIIGEERTVYIKEQDKKLTCSSSKSSMHITLINTTNDELVCSLFVYDKQKGTRTRVTQLYKIDPQQRTIFPVPYSEPQDKKDGAEVVYVLSVRSKKEQQTYDGLSTDLEITYPFYKRVLRIIPNENPLQPIRFAYGYGETDRVVPNILWLAVPQRASVPSIKLAQAEHRIIKDYGDIPNKSKIEHNGTEGNFLIARDLTNFKAGDREGTFITKRLPRVQKSIKALLKKENYLAQPNDVEDTVFCQYPTMALIFPGGGYRAMIGFAGFMQGAEERGILDCCTYIAGLSGSAWGVAGFINSLDVSDNTPRFHAEEFAEKLEKYVDTKITNRDWIVSLMGARAMGQLFHNVVNDADYVKKTISQERFYQFQGWEGFYGHALAQALLQKDHDKTPHTLTFSDLQKKLDSGTVPFPICVAIDSQDRTVENHRWVEFSPYYVGLYEKDAYGLKQGNINNGLHIPTELFGCRFDGGKLYHIVPEYPLAYLMGIWGLAFGVDIFDARNEGVGFGLAVGAARTYDIMRRSYWSLFPGNHGKKPQHHEDRLTFANVPNFLHDSSDHSATSLSSPEFDTLRKREDLSLIDGGIYRAEKVYTHNFATIPLLARKTQVLILCDTTYTPDAEPDHLIAAALEADRLGLPFPINAQHLRDRIRNGGDLPEPTRKLIEQAKTQHAVLIHDDTQPYEKTGPIIVYMKVKADEALTPGFKPDVKHSPYIDTKNFGYNSKQYRDYKDHARKIMAHNQTYELIQEAMYRAQRRPIDVDNDVND